MRLGSKLLAVAVTICVTAALVARFYSATPKAPRATPESSPSDLRAAGTAPPDVARPPIAMQASSPVERIRTRLSLQQQVDRYRSTGTPEDALAAYKLIWHCIYVRRDHATNTARFDYNQAPPESESDACGDLASSTIAGSYQLLAQAAKAGVHGAAAMVADAGEDGLGTTDYSNPDVERASMRDYLQRMQDASDAGVASGDCFSLNSKSLVEDSRRDYEAALRYLNEAAEECPKQKHKLTLIEQRRARYVGLIGANGER